MPRGNITYRQQYYGDMEVIYPIENTEPGDPLVLVRMKFNGDVMIKLLAIDAAKEVFQNATYNSYEEGGVHIVDITIRLERGLRSPKKYQRSNAEKIARKIYDNYY